MKRNTVLLLLLSSLFIFMTACSSGDSNKMDQEESAMDMDSNKATSSLDTYSGGESFAEKEMSDEMNNQEEPSPEKYESTTGESGEMATDRMIIHQAQLHVNVKNLEEAQLKIEKKVSEYGGYIVESNVYREDDEHVNSYMTVRIPEKHFQHFLTDAEETAADVLERIVTGQDITEEYVDLESRLRSKRVVEERLLAFMEDAKKTEDLLKISTDLASVQEDIEVVVGRINYLKNQSAYSTIEISMYENRINIPELENKDLNTWEKTKKQLATSLNLILATGSGLIIFLIGNLPFFIILLFVGSMIYLFIKKRKTD